MVISRSVLVAVAVGLAATPTACSPYADRLFPSGSGGSVLADGSFEGGGPVCGNNVQEKGEACDDGHRDVCDTCNADCTGPGNMQPVSNCRCADGTIEQDFTVGVVSGVTMVGCADLKNDPDAGIQGTTWDNRATLCGSDCKVCHAVQWMGLHTSGTITAPTFNYWTDDLLVLTAGTQSAKCAVGQIDAGTELGLCMGRPMRVCKHWPIDGAETDDSNTSCDLHDCTFGASFELGSTNYYFGGCVNNFTAGALCCCG